MSEEYNIARVKEEKEQRESFEGKSTEKATEEIEMHDNFTVNESS